MSPIRRRGGQPAAPRSGPSKESTSPAIFSPKAKSFLRGLAIVAVAAYISFQVVRRLKFFKKDQTLPAPTSSSDDGSEVKEASAVDLDRAEVDDSATADGSTPFSVWLPAGKVASPEPTMANVSCAPRKLEGSCGLPRTEDRCARFVLDNAVDEADAREVRSMVSWLVAEAWGGGSGPPSVVDLHQGSISYKDKFIELAALMEFKSIGFTQAQKDAYERVRSQIRRQVAGQFGIPVQDLLHDFTFFSHINGSKTAQTVHDEYWHLHIDTEQYGTFEYTSLLYLTTEGEDFSGGEFLFLPSEDGSKEKPVAVEPRFNRLVAFTSDAENPHRVEKVRSGIRIALTAAFTCNREKAAAVGPAFPAKLPDSA